MNTTFSTLIDAASLQRLLDEGADVAIFDCSFDLANVAVGREAFLARHLVGAQFADLDADLSEKRPGAPTASAGRHPLPTREAFAAWLGSRGVGPGTQVVVYDRNAQMFCGRMWWMCQWVGHAACAVLDGGLAAWEAAGGALDSGAADVPQAVPHPLSAATVPTRSTAQVHAALGGAQTIVDARATPRFRGEVEPLDPVAGHIPGALNRPFAMNFDASGKFKPREQLRQEFDALLQGRDPAQVVHHCGSGVTATPNVLAMLIAGYDTPALYPGSWSEWCNTAGMPVATGG